MSEFWLKLLGYDVTGLPQGATTHLVFTHAPHSWKVFVLLALMLGLVWGVMALYRREIDTCPRHARIVLAITRSVILVLLITVLLGPALVVSTQRIIEPYVGILVDRSLSMSLVDRPADPAVAEHTAAALGMDSAQWRAAHLSRAQVAQRLLKRNHSQVIEQLRRVNHVKVMAFDNATSNLTTFEINRPDTAKGPTALARKADMLPFNLAWWLGTPALLGCVLAIWMLAGRPVIAAATVVAIVAAGVIGGVLIVRMSSPVRADQSVAGPAASPASAPAPVAWPPLTMEGPGILATDLSGAIREALSLQSRHPISALVLLTDGQPTAGADPLAAAEQAGQQNVPIFPVGLGDPAAPRNLRVAELWSPDTVFTNNPLLIQARLRLTGCKGRTVRVQLVEKPIRPDGSAGQETIVAERSLTVADDQATIEGPRATFRHTPTRAGNYVYTVRLPALPDELVSADNARSNTVRVLSDQARVLLVAGGPSWDYRNLARLLIRDKTINVSCWLQSMDTDMRQDGNTVIDHLPRDPKALFQYDLVILLDPDPREFDEAWIDTLRRFLDEHAGGLLYMAGPKYTARLLTRFSTQHLGDLLPVRFGQLSAVDVESLITTHTQAWPLRLTSVASDHALLRLMDDSQANQALWKMMPGIYWSFPARAAKPASQVLIEHADPRLRRREGARPLMVVGQFGPGRVLYLGFDGTWRWRRLGEQYFDRFWIQSVRHLIEGRLLGGRKRGRIETDRDVYDVGARIAVTARLYDQAFKPLVQPRVDATIHGAGGESDTLTLQPVPNRPGYYQGAYTATGVGVHEIALSLPGDERGPVRVARQITVQVPRAEFADPRLNLALLHGIAEHSGGRYLRPDQFVQLPQLIADKTEILVESDKPSSLWDTDRMLIVVVLLLTFEWALRKRYKLM